MVGSLASYWMPFTANRSFKQSPRMIVAAAGAYLLDADGRQVFDGLSGLWCSGLGHCHPEISSAIGAQSEKLDYAPAFQFGHPSAFELANRLAALAPSDLNSVFFTSSGSEAADTSLKMARAYWRSVGKPSKTKFIGREKGYHGVNFGGTSVGGIGYNRAPFGEGISADHLAHTQLRKNAFTRGIPEEGAELAEELLNLIQLHGAANIAALVIEPFSGSGGVVVPPRGYLARLREICSAHDILLIFDEVITAFGRAGAMFGATAFDVVPDIMNVAKQITNGAIPLGAVIARERIHDAINEAGGARHLVEFPHGYTYSGHPVACAAGLATLDLIERDQIVERVQQLAPYFEDSVHRLRGGKYISDVRNIGLAAGITIEAAPGEPARRPMEIGLRCWEAGFYVRFGGDTIQLAPPFISSEKEIDALVDCVGNAVDALR